MEGTLEYDLKRFRQKVQQVCKHQGRVHRTFRTLDAAIAWSNSRTQLVEFASSAAKDQDTVKFVHRVSGATVWKAYPAGEIGAKIVVCIRESKGFPGEVRERLRESLKTELGLMNGKPETIDAPMEWLAAADGRLHRFFQILEKETGLSADTILPA